MTDIQDSTQEIAQDGAITSDVQKLHDIIIDLLTIPNELEIKRFLDEKGVLLTVHVNAKDMGIVIGRQGIMIDSLRIYMRAWGKSHDMNIRIEVLEPDGSTAERNNAETHEVDQDVESLIA